MTVNKASVGVSLVLNAEVAECLACILCDADAYIANIYIDDAYGEEFGTQVARDAMDALERLREQLKQKQARAYKK